MSGPRLCGACGARLARGEESKACGVCGAPPTAWVVEEGKEGWGSRIAMSLVMVVSGLACFVAALSFLSGWAFPSLGWKVLQVALGLVVVPFGMLTGVVLLYGSGEALAVTSWQWTSTTREEGWARAKAVFGRVKSAEGWSSRQASPLAVPAMRATPVEVFRLLKSIRAAVLQQEALGIGTPPTVDLLLVFALMRLASAGVLDLAMREGRSWNLGTRGEWSLIPSSVTVRRGTAPVGPLMDDPVSALLLGAMATLDDGAVTNASVVGAGAYRQIAMESEREPGAWVKLGDFLDAVVRPLRHPRQSIRDRMRHHADLAPVSVMTDEDVLAEVRGVVAWRPAGNVRAVVHLLVACLPRLSPMYKAPEPVKKDVG